MIKVVKLVAGGYYEGDYTSGGLIDVTLTDGQREVTCKGILIWEDEQEDIDAAFDEWLQMAAAGEEGYEVIEA